MNPLMNPAYGPVNTMSYKICVVYYVLKIFHTVVTNISKASFPVHVSRHFSGNFNNQK